MAEGITTEVEQKLPEEIEKALQELAGILVDMAIKEQQLLKQS